MAASSLASPLRKMCQLGLRAAISRLPVASADACASPMTSSNVFPVSGWMPNSVGTMELGVPKSKITPSRKGKRNGPKFLRPVSVIARCTVCGRVKLPQFFCCDGTKPQSSSEKE